MADDSAKVDDQGPEDPPHIVRTVARQVENAGDRLGDWIEGGANISQVEIGPALDAIAALGAAGPMLRMVAGGYDDADDSRAQLAQMVGEQDALRGRAVREIADTMAGDLADVLADVLGRPAGEPVPPWNMLLRIVRAMVVEDAEHALPEIPQSAVVDLALAVGWSASDVRGVPGAWARLLREVRDQAQGPAPTLSTRMALEALGYDATVAGGTWSPAAIIDAIRSTVAKRNAAIDAAAAERARINTWAGQLAALLLDDNPAEDWGSPLGLDQLMTAVRQAVATLSTDVLDVATAVGYRNPDASGGQLPSRVDWPSMMRDLATLRDQPAEQALDLAAALGQPDAGELGASFDDLLDAVRALVEQQAESANQIGANPEPTPAGPPPPAETDPREDWPAHGGNLFEARPAPNQTYTTMAPPADDDGHGPDGQG